MDRILLVTGIGAFIAIDSTEYAGLQLVSRRDGRGGVMENTHAAGPWIACACALVLGIAGMAAGIVVQFPALPAQPPSVATPVVAKAGGIDIPQPRASRDDVKSFSDRRVVSHMAAASRPE